jgi:hypothetical protein
MSDGTPTTADWSEAFTGKILPRLVIVLVLEP